jgi:6-phosphofructokinase 1
VIDVPLADAVSGPRSVDTDGDMIHTAQGLGIYVGEPPHHDG